MATFDTKPPLQLLKVAEKRTHCPGLVTFVFRSGTDEPLAPARAGKYIALTGEFDGSRVTRAYTLASSPRETEKEGVYIVTVKKAGVLSGWLTDRTEVGGKVLAGVPLGDFVYDEERDESHIVGVAGGAGITALLSLAKASSDGAPYTMTLFYAVDDSREFLFDEELAALDPSRVKVVRIAADGTEEILDIPKNNSVYYELENGSFVCVRPSGTEPKLKIYYSVKLKDFASSEKAFEKLSAATEELLHG